jgi:hypothetical protein
MYLNLIESFLLKYTFFLNIPYFLLILIAVEQIFLKKVNFLQLGIFKDMTNFIEKLWTKISMINKQCFGSGSGSAWIRIKFVSWVRIRIPNADPDPAADKISSKSQNNSYHLELFD